MTLIEVLVALLVLGTAAATLLALLSVHTANTVSLEDNVLGRIAAENAMVDAVLAEEAGVRSDEDRFYTFGGRTFGAIESRIPSPIEGLDLLTVIVRDEDGRAVAELGTLRPAELTQ
jgi:type II secretion system protein I